MLKVSYIALILTALFAVCAPKEAELENEGDLGPQLTVVQSNIIGENDLRLRPVFANWRSRAIARKEYVDPEDSSCSSNGSASGEIALENKFLRELFGDINGDGIDDAWIQVEAHLCDGGNAVGCLDFFLISKKFICGG